jgi:hypothetical protein
MAAHLAPSVDPAAHLTQPCTPAPELARAPMDEYSTQGSAGRTCQPGETAEIVGETAEIGETG